MKLEVEIEELKKNLKPQTKQDLEKQIINYKKKY